MRGRGLRWKCSISKVKKKKRDWNVSVSTRTRDEGTDLLDGYMTLLSGSRAWNGRAIVVVSTKCNGMSKRGPLLRGGGNYNRDISDRHDI